MVRQVERTKVCNGCEKSKPWSQFYAAKRWDDGTMRVPTAKCRPCSNAYRNEYNRNRRRADPAWARSRDQADYQRLRTDPERWGVRLDQNRAAQARRRGYKTSRGPRRRVATMPMLPAGPFIAWLETFGGPGDIERATGLLPRHIRRLREGSVREVELDTVDRAAIHADVNIGDIYPLGLAA